MTILKTVLASVGATILSLNAMATTPKGETKDAKTTDGVAAPTETKSQAGANYYWFAVDPSTGDLTSTTAKSNTASALDPDGCTTGSQYCGRAFNSSDTHISGGQRVLNSGVDEDQSVDISQKN